MTFILLIWCIVSTGINFILLLDRPNPTKRIFPLNQHTLLEWCKMAGVKGANAKSSAAATVANFKVRKLMFSTERNGIIYWGLCGITKQELIEKIRFNALRHKEQGMPDITIVEL